MKYNVASFYEDPRRLEYHPSALFTQKRKGIKRIVAFDDRFEQVNKELESLITKISKPLVKILDIGVGDGIYEEMIGNSLKRKCELYGVDISSKQMARARKYLKESKIVDLNSGRLPYCIESFDIVIASEILEHIFYPEKVLEEAVRVLRKKGFLLLTFPNSASLQLRLGLLIKGSSPLLNYPQNAEHIRFFTSSDIKSLLSSNMKLITKSGLSSFLFDKWNFFYKFPMPRILQVLGNSILPNWALGNLLILQKK